MMDNLLYCKDFYDPIELKGKKHEKRGAEEWKRLNGKVVGTIEQ